MESSRRRSRTASEPHDRTTVAWDAPRAAITTIFLLDGLTFGAWVAHLPLLKSHLALSDLRFSAVLAGMVGGAFIAQPLAGVFATRIGSRPVTRLASVASGLALAVPALAPSLAALIAATALLGFVRGATEVPMNAQASLLETRHARPRMSSFHAGFSLGGFLGSGLAALLLGAGLPARVSLALVGVGAAIIAAIAGRYLLPETSTAATSSGAVVPESAPAPASMGTVLRDSTLLLLGALAFCGLVGEGAMADWSALLLERTTHVAPAAAALGYAAFSVAMTVGRVTGDMVIARLGPVRTLRTSGVLACLGMVLALLAPYGPALVGCAIVGFGYANLVPILYSASGRRAGSAGVAAVSTLGYAGFVVGPPVIGGLAQATGTLPGALSVVAVLALLIAAMAGVLGRTRTGGSLAEVRSE